MIKIDNKLLELMRKGDKVIMYNNKQYRALGRGAEGNVYSFDPDSNLAIKVFRKYSSCYKHPNVIEKEIYVMHFLKDLDQIRDNIVDILDYESCISGRGYFIMELYDGDLGTWVHNAMTKGIEETEDAWISMIFQITFAFKYINEAGILHGDPKPKNIFYTKRNLKNPNNDGNRTYIIDGKSYNIPFTTRFVLGDFSKVRIVEMDRDITHVLPGESGTPDIYYNLTHATDLYEISRILFRALVNSTLSKYSKGDIQNMVNHYSQIDQNFAEQVRTYIIDINKMIVNETIKERIRIRFYAYELIEYNYITIEQIQERDPQLVIPSQKIQKLLVRLQDPNETMETLFSDFLL